MSWAKAFFPTPPLVTRGYFALCTCNRLKTEVDANANGGNIPRNTSCAFCVSWMNIKAEGR